MSSVDTGKTYHTTASGDALKTVNEHQAPSDITLFSGCFCPYVQRVWIALEYLEINYHYYEVDPYKKPADLLSVSPKGLVPALKLNNTSPPRALSESTVILEYLEDLSNLEHPTSAKHLLPPLSETYARYLLRQQTYHINRAVVPAFYRYLQAQNPADQIENGKAFLESIIQLICMFESAEESLLNAKSPGLWGALGKNQPQRLNLADVMVAPWLFRSTNVLKHYRGFSFPPSTKFQEYLKRLLDHSAVKKTCSDLPLYLDSYERYAFNRPNTSQVANAINAGRELP